MTHVTSRLTAKNWDELQNHTLSNRVCATFYLQSVRKWNEPSCLYSVAVEHLHTLAVTPFLSVHFSRLSCPGRLVKYQGGLLSMWATGRNAPLIRFWILALYILFACLYHTLPHLSFFSSCFPYLSPPLLNFPFENRPVSFPGRMPKPGFSSFLFILYCSTFFWLVNVCFCGVGFSFFHTKLRDLLGETSPKCPILCRVRHKSTTQSIRQVVCLSWDSQHPSTIRAHHKVTLLN